MTTAALSSSITAPPDISAPTASLAPHRQGAAAVIIARHSYRLHTLTTRSDALVLVLRGCKQLISATQSLTVAAGQAVMMAGDTTWDVVNDPAGHSRYEALALAFEAEWMAPVAAQDWPRAPHPVHSARALEADAVLLESARRCGQDGSAGTSAALQRHRLQEVLLLLAERGWVYAPRRDRPWADRVRQMVAQRPDADWSVPVLAAAFHASESTLRRRLEDAGVPLATLVRETRLEVALHLLQTTEFSVGDVAQRCGWTSHSRFSAAFQARWGVPPRLVRGGQQTALPPGLGSLAHKLAETG